MDDRSFNANFGFLNESFTLNEIEKLEKFRFQQPHSRKTQICSELREGLDFDYGYTMNLLFTN